MTDFELDNVSVEQHFNLPTVVIMRDHVENPVNFVGLVHSRLRHHIIIK
jgi:hypothetical protein